MKHRNRRNIGPREKTKVLYIVHSIPSGGIETILLSLCKRAREREVEPFICCLVSEGEGSRPFRDLKIPIRVLHAVSSASPLYLGRNLKALMELYVHIREVSPHVVQAEMFFAGTLGRIAAYLSRVPVILHSYHNYYPWKGYFAKFLERQLAKLSNALIVPSEAVKEWTAKDLSIPQDQFYLISNGIDAKVLEDSKKECKTTLGFPEDAPVLCFCSRFVEQKRPLFAAEVFLDLAKSSPSLHFLAVGDGPLRESFIDYCQDVSTRLHCPGRVDSTAFYLRASDLLIMPSKREGFGLVPGEALLQDCLVLLSSLPPLLEVYGKLGKEYFLSPEADCSKWTERARDLLSTREERTSGLEPMKRAIKKSYGPEEMTRKYFELYRSKASKREVPQSQAGPAEQSQAGPAEQSQAGPAEQS